MSPTAPRGSKRMCWERRSVLVDVRDEVAFLDRLLRLDVDFSDDTRNLRDDRDLHLHGLEDDDLVSLGHHLALFGDDLPDVCGDLGPNLVHRGKSTCLHRCARQTALVSTFSGTYDTLAPRFDDWSAAVVPPQRERWAAKLEALVPAGARVVELGCG